MSFSQQVGKWTQHTAPEAVAEEMQAITTELFGSVIEDTPVDKGGLRANWQPSSATPATGTINSTDGSGVVRDVKDFLSKFDFMKQDFVVYLTNNLPYANVAEYGGWNGPTDLVNSDGYSRKAPGGMVRKNLIRVSQNLKTRL